MRFWFWITRAAQDAVLGAHLRDALRRHEHAAAQLDAAVREVLGK